MMKMKLLEVVTPPPIYRDLSTQKMFWEEKFTGEEKLTLGEFTAVNMKKCGCLNVSKHRKLHHLGHLIEVWQSGQDENQLFRVKS